MRYTSDDIDTFQLHDARFLEVRRDGSDLRWRLGDAIALDTCPENPHGCDMYIADLWVTFENCELRAVTVCGGRSYSYVTKAWTEIPPLAIPPEDRWQALNEVANIYGAYKHADEGARRVFLFSLIASESGRLVDFEFLADNIRLEWDEYAGIAWFEERRQAQSPDSE